MVCGGGKRVVAAELISKTDEDELSDSDDDDSDGSFHYPDASSSVRALSVRSHSTDYFSRPSTSRASTDLTPQLSQAPEFRVPTHESPQNILTPRPNPVPHSIDAQWERDEAVMTCRGCSRRFTLFIRKVSFLSLNCAAFADSLSQIACMHTSLLHATFD